MSLPATQVDPVRTDNPIAREEALKRWLGAQPGVMVAFSGGVDSSYLLDVALEVLGTRTLAVTADSPSLSREACARAIAFCQQRGVRHQIVATSEFTSEEYRANTGNRCYFCKSALLEAMQGLRAAQVTDAELILLIGAIADDLGDHRPGMRAAAEGGARWPMADLGFTKADVRTRSRARGLATWDLPAQPCLSSRVPYGEAVTPEAVGMIERAEVVLHRHGFVNSRARHHGVGRGADGRPRAFLCRIEVPDSDFPRLMECRLELLRELRGVGYLNITLDLGGLASGSLNALLTADDRKAAP